MTVFRGRLWQNGAIQAEAQHHDVAVVEKHVAHYALVYGQDAPVTVEFHEKRHGRWRKIGLEKQFAQPYCNLLIASVGVVSPTKETPDVQRHQLPARRSERRLQ